MQEGASCSGIKKIPQLHTKLKLSQETNISYFSNRLPNFNLILECGILDEGSGVATATTTTINIIKTSKKSEVDNRTPDLKDYSGEHWNKFYPMFIDYRKRGGMKTLGQLISNAHLKHYSKTLRGTVIQLRLKCSKHWTMKTLQNDKILILL